LCIWQQQTSCPSKISTFSLTSLIEVRVDCPQTASIQNNFVAKLAPKRAYYRFSFNQPIFGNYSRSSKNLSGLLA